MILISKKEKENKKNKTAQESIKYKKIYDDGIMEVEKGVYSLMVKLEDINYQIANKKEQETIFDKYCAFLNYFDCQTDLQITINHKNVNIIEFENEVLLKKKTKRSDVRMSIENCFDNYRAEYNDMLKKQLRKGQNNIVKEKYITLKIKAHNYKSAKKIYTRLLAELKNNIVKLGSSAKKVEGIERLQVLHDFFNTANATDIKNYNIKKRGLSCKDIIAPDYFNFKRDYFEMGNKYARTLFLKGLPTHLTDKFISELSDFNSNMMLTINIKSVDPAEGLRLVQRQLTSMNQNKIEQQRKAIKSGYSPDILSYDLQHSLEDAEMLLSDMKKNNQKMFFTNLVITHIAKDLETLNDDTNILIGVANKHICSLGVLGYQQEEGLNATLPISNNKLKIDRTLTTESLGVFMPFVTREVNDKNGIYYGLNAISKNLLLVDRKKLATPSALFLGQPGSGKSLAVKREIIHQHLKNNKDATIILDPDREYTPLAKAFNGEVIKINAGSSNNINILQLNRNYGDTSTPIQKKSEHILAFVEIAIGRALTATEKSVIDECLYLTYERSGYLVDYEEDKTPTLVDFINELKFHKDEEAKKLATSLNIYTNGSLNMFARKTNINLDKRLIVFDIQELGMQLKPLAMLVILDYVWNILTSNRQKQIDTWIYADEFHLMFENQFSSDFFSMLYKRARKYNGIVTAITQNVEELVTNTNSKNMVMTSQFVAMFRQEQMNLERLTKLYSLSETQEDFIRTATAGSGLLKIEEAIIPFDDNFPKDTELYRLINTDTKKEEL